MLIKLLKEVDGGNLIIPQRPLDPDPPERNGVPSMPNTEGNRRRHVQ